MPLASLPTYPSQRARTVTPLAYRKKFKLTQAAAALAFRVTEKTWRRWELAPQKTPAWAQAVLRGDVALTQLFKEG